MTDIRMIPTLNHRDDRQQQQQQQQQHQQQEPEKQRQSLVLNSIIAGSMAGMASVAIFHPFDVVRTKIQTGTFESFSKSTSTPSPKTSPNEPIAMLTHTLRNGGVRALYTGLSLPLAAQAAYKATVFTINRETKRLLAERRGLTTTTGTAAHTTDYGFTSAEYFACGATGGFVNALVFVCPVEYVRSQLIARHTRMASCEGPTPVGYRRWGPMDVVRRTVGEKGVTGLWRGAGVTVLRDSLGCGAFFATAELGRRHLPTVTGSKEGGGTLDTVLMGVLGGFGYWSVSMPLDSLKTLVQSGTSRSAVGAVKFLVERKGWVGAWRSLFRGWQVAFGRGMPGAAVSLLTYSTVYSYIGDGIDGLH